MFILLKPPKFTGYADLTRIPCEDPTPNSDAVSALVVYQIVSGLKENCLDGEIRDLFPLVEAYLHSPMSRVNSSDPLGLGTDLWISQWIVGPNGTNHLHGLVQIARQVVLSSLQFSTPALNFRVYGALIGMQCTSDESLHGLAHDVLLRMIGDEMSTACGETEHSSINKVMLATALNPIACIRLSDDATVDI